MACLSHSSTVYVEHSFAAHFQHNFPSPQWKQGSSTHDMLRSWMTGTPIKKANLSLKWCIYTHTSYTTKSVMEVRKPARKFLLLREVIISGQNQFMSKSGQIYTQQCPSTAQTPCSYKICIALGRRLFLSLSHVTSCLIYSNASWKCCILPTPASIFTCRHDLKQAILKALERQKYSKGYCTYRAKTLILPMQFWTLV